MEVDVHLNVSSLKIFVNSDLVHEASVAEGGVHVAALHEARGSLLASRTIPTSKPSEAYVLRQTLASFRPGRVLVVTLMPEGARYLAPAEPLLRRLGCTLLCKVGVGEVWSALITRHGTHEAVVTRQPMALDGPSSYDDIVAPVGGSLALGVSLKSQQAVLCSWHRRPEMAQQRILCDTHDGFPELCRCRHPLTPEAALATAPRLPWRESIPCVVATSKHPYHFYRVLLQLVQMAGAAQTPFFIRLEGECPATEALARLFNIPLSKHYTALRDRSMSSVTHLIAAVTHTALNDTFTRYPEAHKVIFMEDDVLLSPDFLWYFQQTAQLMNEDPSVLAVSAHHTYSFAGLGLDPTRLLRGVMPPQWGWMATRRLIQAWVPDYWGDWDYWVMVRARSEGLDIVFPELSRSLHAGSSGTHIDGFQQAMVFNRQSANLGNLTDLVDLSGLHQESYSATLRTDVMKATPLTLTSPHECGPNLIPDGQDGPFVMFLGDYREHYAVLWCLGMYSEDLRGDFEQVQQLRVAGRKVFLVDCPQSPHCVRQPAGYRAVPHDDHLMEALAALNLFRRNRELRTPFRIRRRPKDHLEEAHLANVVTGFAVVGFDRPTFFLNKGMILPQEEASGNATETGVRGESGGRERCQDNGSGGGVVNRGVSALNKGSHGSNTSNGVALHVPNITGEREKISTENASQGQRLDLMNKKDKPEISVDMVKYGKLSRSRNLFLRGQTPRAAEERGSAPYTYYKTCVTSTCVVSDPLLHAEHLPRLLQVVANIAQRETKISHDPSLEFTVQDFYDNPKLFKSFFRYP